jgi:hypothetical protein
MVTQKTVIFQKEDVEKNFINEDLINVFNDGLFPVIAGKDYDFKVNLNIYDEFVNTDLFFGMIGDVANISEVNYTSKVFNFEGNALEVVLKKHKDFTKKEIIGSIVNANTLVEIFGTFKCNINGFLQPAITNGLTGTYLHIEKGSFIEVNTL